MLSYTPPNVISFDSIISVIDDIKHTEEQRFGFDDFKYELDKVEYTNKTKYESVRRINEWVESVSYHTFPKTKRTWINTIISQPNLRNLFVSYKVHELVTNVYLKEHIHLYILNYYHKIYNEHKQNVLTHLDNKSILCKLAAVQVFDNLIEFGIISLIGKRVYINRYKFETSIDINKSKRCRVERPLGEGTYDDTGNDADSECDPECDPIDNIVNTNSYKKMRICN